MDLELSGRRALLIGAGRGLGGAAAVALARERASVALVARTGDDRVLHLPAHYVADAIDYGYATSLHKGQGRTVGDPTAGRPGRA